MSLKQAEILGVNVNSLTMVQAVEKVQQFIDERENALIATANAEMLMRATQDEELKHILNSADLVVPDGAGTVWAANYLGVEMPERVAGYDLAQELMREAPSRGDRIYFFGSAPGVAESAREKAMELYPGIKIVGTRNGFFSEADEPEIIAEIKAARPDILLAALGVPKQEKWLYKYRQALQVPVAIGVGGTLDVMAGVMQRAPLWMQKAKLEWLFRGLKQPSRAGRLLALPKFVMKVMASKK
ncbi:MAG: WecB/TagA/CpsF family glycosyltransferase [Veillonellaceae bacterium]|nr:WecB/TagA/CpsF family glycosyltransferase [Veillonellaceae bacterium]